MTPALDPVDEDTPELTTTDLEMRQLLGMFDVPAFARRGRDLEFTLEHLHARCARERDEMLAMVRLRLRLWAAVASGWQDGPEIFTEPIEDLWRLTSADPPSWAFSSSSPRKRRALGRDLVASVERFNRRWERFVRGLDLTAINDRIDDYNRYYVLEKECSFGSARLAAWKFEPKRRLTAEGLLADHPALPGVEARV